MDPLNNEAIRINESQVNLFDSQAQVDSDSLVQTFDNQIKDQATLSTVFGSKQGIQLNNIVIPQESPQRQLTKNHSSSQRSDTSRSSKYDFRKNRPKPRGFKTSQFNLKQKDKQKSNMRCLLFDSGLNSDETINSTDVSVKPSQPDYARYLISQLQLVKGQEFKDDVKQFRTSYERKLPYCSKKYDFFYGHYEKKVQAEETTVNKYEKQTMYANANKSATAPTETKEIKKKDIKSTGSPLKDIKLMMAEKQKSALIDKIKGKIKQSLSMEYEVIKDAIIRNQVKYDLRNIHHNEQIIELFMKFPKNQSQDEIMQEITNRIRNPNTVENSDSPWGKVAMIILKCMKTNTLLRLREKIDEFYEKAEEQDQIQKAKDKMNMYNMSPIKPIAPVSIRKNGGRRGNVILAGWNPNAHVEKEAKSLNSPDLKREYVNSKMRQSEQEAAYDTRSALYKAMRNKRMKAATKKTSFKSMGQLPQKQVQFQAAQGISPHLRDKQRERTKTIEPPELSYGSVHRPTITLSTHAQIKYYEIEKQESRKKNQIYYPNEAQQKLKTISSDFCLTPLLSSPANRRNIHNKFMKAKPKSLSQGKMKISPKRKQSKKKVSSRGPKPGAYDTIDGILDKKFQTILSPINSQRSSQNQFESTTGMQQATQQNSDLIVDDSNRKHQSSVYASIETKTQTEAGQSKLSNANLLNSSRVKSQTGAIKTGVKFLKVANKNTGSVYGANFDQQMQLNTKQSNEIILNSVDSKSKRGPRNFDFSSVNENTLTVTGGGTFNNVVSSPKNNTRSAVQQRLMANNLIQGRTVSLTAKNFRRIRKKERSYNSTQNSQKSLFEKNRILMKDYAMSESSNNKVRRFLKEYTEHDNQNSTIVLKPRGKSIARRSIDAAKFQEPIRSADQSRAVRHSMDCAAAYFSDLSDVEVGFSHQTNNVFV